MYHFYLQTYEWALEAMKYVASMKMEHCATPEGLEKLLRSLEIYLQEHPPIADDTFSQMSDLAKQLKNDKLLEQCLTAQNRCQETQKMLQLRGTTLRQFRDQLEQDPSAIKSKSFTALSQDPRTLADISKYSSLSAVIQGRSESRHSVQGNSAKSYWDPKDTSTPIVPKTYSRLQGERLKTASSVSLSSSSPSSPSHSLASPASSCSISPCHSTDTSPIHTCSQPHSVHGPNTSILQQNGDISQGANFSTNASVTSNLSAKENLHEPDQRQLTVPGQHVYSRGGSVHNKPSNNNKLLRRAISTPLSGKASPILEEDQGLGTDSSSSRITSLRQNGRTDSMITGSSDSLPR